jgi:hypothetical protein
VALTCALFVFLLFAFPNYCDRCRYRDVARVFAAVHAGDTPPCCAGKASAGSAPGKGGKTTDFPGASANRVPYCIGSTLASMAEQRDVIAEILLAFIPSPYRSEARTFARLFPALDHKDSRGPPA